MGRTRDCSRDESKTCPWRVTFKLGRRQPESKAALYGVILSYCSHIGNGTGECDRAIELGDTLARMAREGLSGEVTFELRALRRKPRKGAPGRRNSMCKGPNTGRCFVYLRNRRHHLWSAVRKGGEWNGWPEGNEFSVPRGMQPGNSDRTGEKAGSG